MLFKYCYLLPIAVGVWFPLTFVTSYVIAMYNNDVGPAFPYISDTGSWSPESCVFGFMLNIGSILMLLVAYIRYRQVKEICDKNSVKRNVRMLNYIGLHLAILSVIGVLLVAHFQETNVFSVHIIGAFLCFGLGMVYLWMQTVISFRIYPIIDSKLSNIARVVLASVATIAFILSGIFGGMAFLKFSGDDVTKWTKENGGYEYHVISSISEWTMAIGAMVFFSTYTAEFKLISFQEPQIVLKV